MTSSTPSPALPLPDQPRGGATTWYEVLDVGPGASVVELRAAYERSLALVEGRTLGGYFLLDPLAVDSARADIEAAWAVLSDVERRTVYDHALGLPPPTMLPAASPTTPPPSAAFPTPPPQTTPVRVPRSPSLKFLAPVLDDSTPPTATTTTPPTATTTPATTTPSTPTTVQTTPTVPTTTTVPPTTATATPTATATTTPTATSKSTTLPTTASPPPFEVALFALDGEVNGQVLKRLREARGLSLDELAELTKIRRPYLQAIEEQDLENLPARVYLRGFLTQIARALRVDKTRLAEGYVAFVARFGG
jgi:hypothetical protein